MTPQITFPGQICAEFRPLILNPPPQPLGVFLVGGPQALPTLVTRDLSPVGYSESYFRPAASGGSILFIGLRPGGTGRRRARRFLAPAGVFLNHWGGFPLACGTVYGGSFLSGRSEQGIPPAVSPPRMGIRCTPFLRTSSL